MSLFASLYAAWDRFWLAPLSGRSLGLIRICLGVALVYNFLAYGEYLGTWFGAEGLVPAHLQTSSSRFPYNISYLWFEGNATWLYVFYTLALVSAVAFTLGIAVPVTGIATFIQYMAFLNRNEFILFGFDEICAPLLLFLLVGRSGDYFALFKVDCHRSLGRNRLSLRLIQCHMCFVYFGAGFGKVYAGWDSGEPLWLALTMTSIANFDVSMYRHVPEIVLSIAAMSVVVWELTFFIGVWHRKLRPYFLLAGFGTHIGIALTMMLAPFSLVMMAGLISFLPLAEIGPSNLGNAHGR